MLYWVLYQQMDRTRRERWREGGKEGGKERGRDGGRVEEGGTEEDCIYLQHAFNNTLPTSPDERCYQDLFPVEYIQLHHSRTHRFISDDFHLFGRDSDLLLVCERGAKPLPHFSGR